MKERARYKGTVAQMDRQKTQCMLPISVRLCMSVSVCPVCVPYMCAFTCVPSMCALYVCLKCMHRISIYVRVCVCAICVHLHVCPVCVPYMCAFTCVPCMCALYVCLKCTASRIRQKDARPKKKREKALQPLSANLFGAVFWGGGGGFLTQLHMRRLEFLAGVKMAGNIFKIAVERLL
jgi:hypothetical protein